MGSNPMIIKESLCRSRVEGAQSSPLRRREAADTPKVKAVDDATEDPGNSDPWTDVVRRLSRGDGGSATPLRKAALVGYRGDLVDSGPTTPGKVYGYS